MTNRILISKYIRSKSVEQVIKEKEERRLRVCVYAVSNGSEFCTISSKTRMSRVVLQANVAWH